MQIISYRDIFSCPHGITEAMCVTTNGIIKNNGHAVMGKGIAKTVDDRYHVSEILANHIKTYGNTPCDLGIYDGFHLISFPTKYNWRDNSSIDLIKESAMKLVIIADNLNLTKIYMTKPGCGCGNLDWESQVKPTIETILDNRFIIIN